MRASRKRIRESPWFYANISEAFSHIIREKYVGENDGKHTLNSDDIPLDVEALFFNNMTERSH